MYSLPQKWMYLLLLLKDVTKIVRYLIFIYYLCNGSSFAWRTEQVGLPDRLAGCQIRESRDSVEYLYRVSYFKWTPRITSKKVIFKENDPDKSCCTQRGTSNCDPKIVVNDLPQGYSKVKVFFLMEWPNFDNGNR